MANFSFSRFVNFGKYDLIINKKFYRNISLLTIFVALGLALIGFLIRYFMFAACEIPIDTALESEIHEGISPEFTFFTNALLLFFASTMSAIFAGYAFHNLRNKQGRIMELTMPATNIERWTWHIFCVAICGTLVIIASILCADLFNALLNLIVYKGKVNSSLTVGIVEIMTGTSEPLAEPLAALKYSPLLIFFAAIINWLFGVSLYTFGNSLKYKYNIILTYIVSYFISTILVIFVFTTFIDRYSAVWSLWTK